MAGRKTRPSTPGARQRFAVMPGLLSRRPGPESLLSLGMSRCQVAAASTTIAVISSAAAAMKPPTYTARIAIPLLRSRLQARRQAERAAIRPSRPRASAEL
jgi:hypothetical protein